MEVRHSGRRRRWSVTLLAVLPLLMVDDAVAQEPTPEILAIVRDPVLVEASGIAADPSSSAFFTIQDAGTDSATIFAIGADGETVRTVDVPGVVNEDWEDLAIGADEQGAPALFVGDIGDAYLVRRNNEQGPRTEFRVVRVAKPEIEADAEPAQVDADDVRVWRFDYADGEPHNAESLLVQPGTNRIFVIDKTEEATSEAFLWVAPEQLDEAGMNTFELVGTVPVTGASGASFSPDGDQLVVRNADEAYLWTVEGGDVAAAITGPPTVVALPPQRQGEGIDFLADGASVVVNSEGPNQPVYRVPLPEPFRTSEFEEPTDAPDPPERSRPPAADLTGSRELPPAMLVGGAVWAVAVVGGALVWRRRRMKR